MSLKNKIIGAVLASALVAPPAFAVEGSDGMHYTSASEGFYASIRAAFNSAPDVETDNTNTNASIGNSGSRFGIQGTGEMSHGLEGFYRYEAAVGIDNGSGITTRLGHVGVRGGFGSLAVGTMWSNEYNWVYGATDLPNSGGGNFVTYGGGVSDTSGFAGYRGRASTSAQYISPDFNGLQVGLRFDFDGGADETPASNSAEAIANALNDEDSGANPAEAGDWVQSGPDAELDQWALSAKYDFSGFTLAGTYVNTPDWKTTAAVGAPGAGTPYTAAHVSDIKTDDLAAWAIRGGYGQDNWGVNAWYGETGVKDFEDANDDNTVFSISGDVTVGKTTVVVLHESMGWNSRDNMGYTSGDDTYTIFDIQYQLNSKAKTWLSYVSRDLDSNDKADDYVVIGLRHDF